jgi:uncharacterized protein (TIGR02271 family)
VPVNEEEGSLNTSFGATTLSNNLQRKGTLMQTVVGLFDDRAEAMRAYNALNSEGYNKADLDVLTSDDESDAPKLDRLSRLIPEPDVNVFIEGVHQGGTLITANVPDADVPKATATMSNFHIVNIKDRLNTLKKARTDLALADPKTNDQVLEVVEEFMDVGKRQVERGRMRIYSKVTEREAAQQVALRDETIHVQRRAVDRPVTSADAFRERQIEMVEIDEVPVVTKSAHVVEEVAIGKEVGERTETVKERLRRTDVETEEIPAGRAFDDYSTDFHRYFDQRLAAGGANFDRFRPAFQYGYGLANNERYRNTNDWAKMESEARSAWETKNPGTWDEFKDTIHYAFDKVRGIA